MNALEKILEEIDKKAFHVSSYYVRERFMDSEDIYVSFDAVKEIIRSHMGDLLDVDAEKKSILCTIGEDGMLTLYDDTYDVIIHCSSKEDQDQTVKLIKESNWIPVGERFPEDGETVLCTDGEDVFLVEYQADVDAGFGDMDWITAWRPLPEPYRTQSEQQPEPNWRQRMMDHFQKIE